jgi:hypothetical protein
MSIAVVPEESALTVLASVKHPDSASPVNTQVSYGAAVEPPSILVTYLPLVNHVTDPAVTVAVQVNPVS